MIRANSRLSRVSLAAALACAASVPAMAAGPAFLKLGGVDGDTKAKDRHKDEIEILSYSWGDSQAGKADALTDGLLVIRNTDEPAAKVSKVDSFTIKQGTAAKESGEKGGTEDINIGVGELQESRGGVSVAAGDVTGDSASAASGQATGKRMHKPLRLTKPLERGSVALTLKGGLPDCRVGMRLPSLEIGGDGNSYTLHDVTVASCGSAADDRPTEEVAFYYNRIAFNYAATPDSR